jgi:hypothetical protein
MTRDKERKSSVVEVQMVRGMIRRSLYVAPALVAALWIWNGSEWALSGAVGLAMTLVNLLLAARIIGSVAENTPRLLLPAAMVALTLGLAVLTGITFALKAMDVVYFPVTGITLVGTHLLLVLWEGAGAYKVDTKNAQIQAQKT